MTQPTPEWLRLSVSPPGPAVREAMAGLLMDWDSGGILEDGDALAAFFPPERKGEVESLLTRYADDLGHPIPWHWQDEPEAGWRDRWKDFFRPGPISPRLAVCPTWEQGWAPEDPGVRVVRMDPGRAFGTGTHETTRLCMTALDRCLARTPKPLLDVGCGSGVLSIGAVLLGSPRAVAVDIDLLAAEATRENAAGNGVGDRVDVLCGDPRSVRGTYPIVVANILFQVLLGLAPILVERVAPGGVLILSGLLTGETDAATRTYLPLGLTEEFRTVDGEWSAIGFRKG